jgi:hypothetical protein
MHVGYIHHQPNQNSEHIWNTQQIHTFSFFQLGIRLLVKRVKLRWSPDFENLVAKQTPKASNLTFLNLKFKVLAIRVFFGIFSLALIIRDHFNLRA